MSSASIGGTSSSLYQYLQNLNQAATQSTASTVASMAASAVTDPTSTASPTTTAIQGAGGGHHGHHGGGGFKKIEDAVTSALQSAQTDGTSSDDPNQTIQDAIEKIMNGASAATSSTTTDPSANTTDTDTDQDGTTAADDASSRQSFFNTLQQYGVDPQQFRQDLMSAMKQAQGGGTADPSTAFKSFPPGVAVDVAA